MVIAGTAVECDGECDAECDAECDEEYDAECDGGGEGGRWGGGGGVMREPSNFFTNIAHSTIQPRYSYARVERKERWMGGEAKRCL